MKKITIIEYGCGNILNLIRAIEFLGYEVETTHNRKKIIDSSHVILPGVGAFGTAMEKLRKYNLENTILEYAQLNKPLLGICLGMQILFDNSSEFGIHKGLGLIEGEVVKISNTKNKEIKIPHVGWNEIYPNNKDKKWKNKILKDSLVGKNFYFVHSFACKTQNPNTTIALCDYSGVSIAAIVNIGNIFGFQFHPEKSADNGLTALDSFCQI